MYEIICSVHVTGLPDCLYPKPQPAAPTMIKLSPQSLIVLRHLKNVGTITAVEASAVHRVRSLSRRITEIAENFCVTKEHKKDVTGQRYVRYSLDTSCDTCQRLFKQVEGL